MMPSRAAPIALCIALVAAGAARTASADIGVVVTGEATLQPQLAAQLEGWLTERGHTVQPSSLEPDAINTLIDCFVIDDLGCARAVVERRARSQAILFARVEMTPNQTDGSRDIAIVGYWLAKGHETLAERRACQRCTEKSMRSIADDLMLALAAEPPTSSHAPSPAAAASVHSGSADEPGAANVLPITLATVGGVALVSGAVMIAAGGPPSSTTQPNYRDYRTPGYVVGAAGVVAAGIGLYLWLRPKAHSAPVAAVTHDGAVVGWTAHF